MDQIAGSVLAYPQFDIQTLCYVLLSSNFMVTSIRGPVSRKIDRLGKKSLTVRSFVQGMDPRFRKVNLMHQTSYQPMGSTWGPHREPRGAENRYFTKSFYLGARGTIRGRVRP